MMALILLWVLAIGIAVNAKPTLRRLTRLCDGNPAAMCAGCRQRRKSLLQELPVWQMLGPAGGAALVVVEAALALVPHPVMALIRRAAGRAPQPRCAGRSCAAHEGYQPAL